MSDYPTEPPPIPAEFVAECAQAEMQRQVRALRRDNPDTDFSQPTSFDAVYPPVMNHTVRRNWNVVKWTKEQRQDWDDKPTAPDVDDD